MPFDFPADPLLNEEAIFAPTGAVWVWDGQKWRAKRGREVYDPQPLIASINPTQANQNEAFTLTVGGSYFEPTSVVTLDGIDAATTFVSEISLTTDVAAQPYGKASLAVNVRDTALLRGANADIILPLIDLRVPLITAIAPTSSNQGVAFTLTVTGTGFVDGLTQVTLNGAAIATTFVSDTSLTAQVPAQAYGAGTTKAVNVSGPNPGTNPNQTLTFVDSRPVVTGISPLAGKQNEALTITATGTFFRADTPITVNGTAITTTFVSATQLTASYTSGYFNPDNLGQLDISVNVTGSPSANTTINLADPRCKIKSCFPDYFSDWIPDWDVEVWCDGIIDTVSVVYIDGVAQSTELKANVVGTEFMLLTHFDLTPYDNDTYIYLTVLNDGKHWSAGAPWAYWVERIGLDKTGPKGPPAR